MIKQDNISKKIAYYSLFIWCLLPTIIMLLNPVVKGTSILYFYIFLIGIGLLGVGNGISYLKKINLIPFLPLIIFLIFTFISCLFANNKFFSIIGTPYLHDGFLSFICYAGFFIDALIISNEKKYVDNCFKSLLLSASLLGIFTLIGKNIFITGANYYEPRIYAAIFSNENHFAYFLTITIMLALFMTIYYNKKYAISFILLSLILIKNDTFGSYIAVFLGILITLIYFYLKKENKLIISILMCIFLGISFFNLSIIKNIKSTTTEIIQLIKNNDKRLENVIIVNNDLADKEVVIDDSNSYRLICAGNSRLDLWIKGIELINKKPLLGYGLENLGKEYSEVVSCDKTDRPHNTFIQILMTTGYLGFTFYSSYIIYLFYNIIKNIKKIDKYMIIYTGIFISYLISSFFGNSMYYTTPYFMIIFGLTSSILLKE